MYRHCASIVAVAGLVILGLGIACTWYGFPALIEWQINENIMLRNGTQAFKIWEKQPFPLLFKVYIFNVTNPYEVMTGSSPILKEVGPFVYNLHIEREVVEINENMDSIEYFLTKRYYYNHKASGCKSEDDIVTIINAPLMGTLLKLEALGITMIDLLYKHLPHMFPGTEDIFLRASVKDLLFGGITVGCSVEELESFCTAMKFGLPTTMYMAPNNKDFMFSMFGNFNKTIFGPFVMTRGIANTSRGALIEFEHETDIGNWPSAPCNMINGSDSGLYERMSQPADKIYTFTPEICRSVGISYEKTVKKSNFVAYKYSATNETLSHEGSDKCFCKDSGYDDNNECPQEGLQDLDSCIGAPVFMSHPHFYLSDPSLLDYAQGLNPRKSAHESFLIIEPSTGTPIKGSKRSQMNIKVKEFDNFPLTLRMAPGIFPILWVEEAMELPADLLETLEYSMQKMSILNILQWIIIALGIALLLLAFILLMKKQRLMCFSSKGSLMINDGKNMVHHIQAYEHMRFTPPADYPLSEDTIFKVRPLNNNANNNDTHIAKPKQ